MIVSISSRVCGSVEYIH